MLRGLLFPCMALAIAVCSSAQSFVDVVWARLPGRNLHLDLYLPPVSQRPAPCIVWLHSGGWRSGHWRSAKLDATDLAQNGFCVAAIQYRLSTVAKWPAQIHDCKGAIRWLRANAVKYGIDPDRIAAFGESSGGQLAAVLATSGGVAELEGTTGGNLDQSSRVLAAANFLGPTDILGPPQYEPANSFASELIGKSIGDIKKNLNDPAWKAWVDLARSVDPAMYVSADDAPLFLAYSTDDTVVPFSQGTHLRDAVQATGTVLHFESVTKGHSIPGHVWVQRRRWLQTWLRSTIEFFPYGKGCGTPDESSIGALGEIARGKTFTVALSAGPSSSVTVLALGFPRVAASLGSLAPGCSAYVGFPYLLQVVPTTQLGTAAYPLFWPAAVPPGFFLYGQWLSFSPNANWLGMTFSNGARILPK